MKIAIVYDWLDSWGGVERLLLALNQMYPDADWYTSFYDEKATIVQKIRLNAANPKTKIRASFMQYLPSFIKRNRILSLPFFPFAFESMDFKGYDLVISVTSSFAKGIITHPDTKHVCILLTPTRWLYTQRKNYELEMRNEKFFRTFRKWFKEQLIKWDQVAAQRPDQYIAISQTVAKRCKKHYARAADVVYPPFDFNYWKSLLKVKSHAFPTTSSHYFLIVSRLEPYKRIDLAVDAFKAMPEKQLIIVGTGSRKKSLEESSPRNITFLSGLDDVELAYMYAHAEALIMTQDEDFGYVALEAQACGCPVIAYAAGGAQETVQNGISGAFFHKQTAEALREAVADFQRGTYNLEETKWMKRFCNKNFTHEFDKLISGFKIQ